MSSAAQRHRHATDRTKAFTIVDDVEYSICDCLTSLIRQIPPADLPGRLSFPIPRDWDQAHGESLLDLQEAQYDAQRGKAVDQTVREGVMRDLYALAQFYVENPSHPLPEIITATHLVDRDQVQALADRFCGGRSYPRWDIPAGQTDHSLQGTSVPVTLVIGVRAGRVL